MDLGRPGRGAWDNLEPMNLRLQCLLQAPPLLCSQVPVCRSALSLVSTHRKTNTKKQAPKTTSLRILCFRLTLLKI